MWSVFIGQYRLPHIRHLVHVHHALLLGGKLLCVWHFCGCSNYMPFPSHPPSPELWDQIYHFVFCPDHGAILSSLANGVQNIINMAVPHIMMIFQRKLNNLNTKGCSLSDYRGDCTFQKRLLVSHIRSFRRKGLLSWLNVKNQPPNGRDPGGGKEVPSKLFQTFR